MNFDELQSQWNRFDEKLDQNLKINNRILRESLLDKTRRSLLPFSAAIIFELIFGFIAVLYLGNFIAEHIRQPEYFIPALLLDIFSIFMIGVSIRHLTIVNSQNYNGSIIDIQKRFESVKIERIRTTKLVFLVSPLLWVPLLIVLFKGFLGLNAYQILGNFYLMVNLLFGLIFIPVVLWLAKRYTELSQRYKLLGKIMPDISDYSLNKAIKSLESLTKFEKGID